MRGTNQKISIMEKYRNGEATHAQPINLKKVTEELKHIKVA